MGDSELLGNDRKNWLSYYNPEAMVSVMETFTTIQGEGPDQGYPSHFIRFQGCPYRCVWCDTKDSWTFVGGAVRTVEDILGEMGEKPCHVCVTGGEPLIQKEIYDLLMGLQYHRYLVTLETSGLFPIKQQIKGALVRGHIVMDWKLPGSKEGQTPVLQRITRENHDTLRIGKDAVKFVVANPKDLVAVSGILKAHGKEGLDYYISPVHGEFDPLEAMTLMKDLGIDNARLQIQIHKYVGVR